VDAGLCLSVLSVVKRGGLRFLFRGHRIPPVSSDVIAGQHDGTPDQTPVTMTSRRRQELSTLMSLSVMTSDCSARAPPFRSERLQAVFAVFTSCARGVVGSHPGVQSRPERSTPARSHGTAARAAGILSSSPCRRSVHHAADPRHHDAPVAPSARSDCQAESPLMKWSGPEYRTMTVPPRVLSTSCANRRERFGPKGNAPHSHHCNDHVVHRRSWRLRPLRLTGPLQPPVS
jgi:hypothetical protein